MRKRVSHKIGSLALLVALGFSSSLPSVSLKAFAPQGLNGQGERHRNDACDELPEPAGNAYGLDKRCVGKGSSSGVSRGDFNGDGFADLAIGAPKKNTPSSVTDSGAVFVIYGSADGLVPAGGAGIPVTQFWSQNTTGVPDTSEAGDRFGSALAAGEFNGDEFSDLAIGIDGEDFDGIENAGRVVVIYGSANGLTATDPSVPVARAFDLRDEGRCPLQCFGQEGLGSALAWGDFNGDTIGDLAIGAPGFSPIIQTGFRSEAGGVWVLFGREGDGLTTAGQQFLDQESPGVSETSGEGDHFGAALAAGDFNGDGRSDLAIGSPGEDSLGVADVGFVSVVLGGTTGLSGENAPDFQENDFIGGLVGIPNLPGSGGPPAAGDEFGTSLAAGDFNGDGKVDLAIGAPERNNAAGMVFIARSTNGALATLAFFTQSALVGAGGSESGDRFGFALAAGDFNANGFTDLAIGVPYEDVVSNGQSIRNAGEVNVVYGTSTAGSGGVVDLSSPGLIIAVGSTQVFRQGTGGVVATLEVDDLFGASLSAWNFGRNETRFVGTPPTGSFVTFRSADLAIGVPLEDVVVAAGDVGVIINDAGLINVLYGSVNAGLTSNGNQQFFQSNIGGFTDVTSDKFGLSLY